MCLHKGPGHPLQKLPGEGGAVRPAPGTHHLLAAVKILLEAAAQDAHIFLTIPQARHLSLPGENEITYVQINCVFVKLLCENEPRHVSWQNIPSGKGAWT